MKYDKKQDPDRKFVDDKICTENICAEFEAERFFGAPRLVDTEASLTFKDIFIDWNNRAQMVDELQAVINKYKI